MILQAHFYGVAKYWNFQFLAKISSKIAFYIAMGRFIQSMVTSTVLSITKQGGFEFLCGRFFSVIFRERCYSIRKILIHIHATSPTTSRRLTRPHQCSGRLLSTCWFPLSHLTVIKDKFITHF